MSDEPVTPPVEPPPPETPHEPISDEAQLDQLIEEQGVTVPDGDRLVSVKQVVGPIRGKMREAKAEIERLSAAAAKTADLEAQLARQQAQWAEALPAVQAAQALLNAQQPPPGPPADDPELTDIAKDLDLWKPDGQPDLERAKRIRDREQRTAAAIAQREQAPLILATLQERAAQNLANAKVTQYPDGTKPDPDILERYWDHFKSSPQTLAMLADKTQATHIWKQALADTLERRATGRAPTPTPAIVAAPPPLHRERAGGQDAPTVTLNEGDRRAARDLGLSEADYAKTAASMPWRRQL